jgi:hypothetical protein
MPHRSPHGCDGIRYTYAQLMGLWINAGGSRAKAPLAAAIAEAESGGCSSATSVNPDGGTNVGPWQLDTPGGVGAGYSVEQLKNGATNAKVAVKGSNNGRDFGAWETFVNGAYKQFMNGRTTPDLSVPSPGTGGPNAQQAEVTAYNPNDCLWTFPGIPVPVLGNLGRFCVLSKSEARAWIGAAVLAAGGLAALVGVALIAAAAGTKALGAAGPVLERTGGAVALIPGAEAAGVAIAATGRAGRSSAAQTRARRQRGRAQAANQETAAQRRLGEPREAPELRTGRGAIRESPAGTRARAGESSAARSRRYAAASSSSNGNDRPPF